MNMNRFRFFSFAIATLVFISCNNSATSKENAGENKGPQIKEDKVSYTSDNTTMNGYVVYSDSIQGKRPGVLVVHEWWGLNDYTRNRAKQLAEMGYIALAVDMYGNGQTAANPDEAMKLAGPFYQDPQLAKTRLDAA